MELLLFLMCLVCQPSPSPAPPGNLRRSEAGEGLGATKTTYTYAVYNTYACFTFGVTFRLQVRWGTTVLSSTCAKK